MSAHPLIACASRAPYKDIPSMPNGVTYDRNLGYWIYEGKPLVKNEQFADQHASKKCDQETGEDQKGE